MSTDAARLEAAWDFSIPATELAPEDLVLREIAVRQAARQEGPSNDDILGYARFTDADLEPPPPMLIDRLDPTGLTILYGDGGAGKGVVASNWIVQLIESGRVPAIVDYESHKGEWARRISGLGGREMVLSDDLHYFAPSLKGNLSEVAERLRESFDQKGIDVAVVDSAIWASRSEDFDANQPDGPLVFERAATIIGRPLLTIAHIAKGGASVFGSAFWTNLARITWSLDADRVTGERILKNVKNNNYLPSRVFSVVTDFDSHYVPIKVRELPFDFRPIESRWVPSEAPEPARRRRPTDVLDEDLGW